jgi:hypothetical protein
MSTDLKAVIDAATASVVGTPEKPEATPGILTPEERMAYEKATGDHPGSRDEALEKARALRRQRIVAARTAEQNRQLKLLRERSGIIKARARREHAKKKKTRRS